MWINTTVTEDLCIYVPFGVTNGCAMNNGNKIYLYAALFKMQLKMWRNQETQGQKEQQSKKELNK